MNDDFDGPEEHRLHSLFHRLRRQVFQVSEQFSLALRRRLREAPSPRYRHVDPTRVVGGSLVEIVNVLSRLLGGSPPSVGDRTRGAEAPKHEERER